MSHSASAESSSHQQHVLIVAGEASGDMHAANLVRELQKRQPDLQIAAMGGETLRETGVEIVVDNRELAVMGLVEVIKHYPVIRRALKTMEKRLETSRPDLLILVDYVEFNLRLAKKAKALGIKVLFYISPQIWAWRSGRIKQIGALIDMMAVILPFEQAMYEANNIPARYVGHPLTGHVKASRSKAENLQHFGLKPDQPVIGLLPGSRRGEITRLLPVFIETAKHLRAESPERQFVLPIAAGIERDFVASFLPADHGIVLIKGESAYDVMQVCDVVLTASGTATLETALMEIPMLMAYKVAPVTYAIFSRMIKTPWIGLVNNISRRFIVQEFIQHRATVKNLAAETNRLLNDEAYRQQVIKDLRAVKALLGEKRGSDEVAKLVASMLAEDK